MSCEGYRTILMDPPWEERGGGRIRRGADRHYPLLSTPEIIAAVLRCELFRPAQKAHLYVWTTNNFLPDALLVVRALGFKYTTLITWTKDRFGLGRYFRGQTEHLVFAVRGYLPPKVRNRSTWIHAPRMAHSQKPAKAYELIEAVSPGPYLELFARTRRPGWDAWGNELKPDLFTLEADPHEKVVNPKRDCSIVFLYNNLYFARINILTV